MLVISVILFGLAVLLAVLYAIYVFADEKYGTIILDKLMPAVSIAIHITLLAIMGMILWKAFFP